MMNARFRRTVLLLVFLQPAAPGSAVGIHSDGNTDGVLTWQLGTLGPGMSARETILFVFDHSFDQTVKRLQRARTRFAQLPSPSEVAGDKPTESPVWIKNDTTDFALEGSGFFRWRSKRQALTGPEGGQLSQFTYYIHYRDTSGEHRAGTPHVQESTPENLRIVQHIHAVSKKELIGLVETTDGKLRVRVRAVVGPGSTVGVQFVLTSLHTEPMTNLRLSAYANLESAHTESDDYSVLDRGTAGLLVADPVNDVFVIMAGLAQPVAGHSGTWNSLEEVQTASGMAFDQWQSFTGFPTTLKRKIARLRARAKAPKNIYLPHIVENPETPETRSLMPREARAALERDWLFQTAGEPLVQRTFKEICWTRELAARLATNPETPDLQRDLSKLDGIDRRLKLLPCHSSDEQAAKDLYLATREIKRRIMFKNPLIDFDRLLFIDQPMPRGPVNDTHEAIHRMGITATPGGRLLVLNRLHPGGEVCRLAPDKPGSFWRPDLSFDATRALFCFKPHNEKSFHLYEVNLDGSELRQLTHSEYDDTDPIYLPDGHIIFTTTRGNSYVRCGPFIYSYVLARCDADGSNVYLISRNGEPDFVPALLNDGRVIYSRWEYTDKALWRVQSLWTTNQDGTNTMVFWGNQSVWPDHPAESRPIPNSRRVMFSGVGHHDWWSGSIGIIDPEQGVNYPNGLTKVTCDLRWPECSIPPEDRPESNDYHASGKYSGYKTPYPLSEEDFLVSARGQYGQFRLYLMDVHGNRDLIYEGVHNILHAIPVKSRPVPPQQPDRVVWPGTGKDRKPVAPGILYSADVCQGVPDLPRGMVKYLRVFQLDHKTYSTWGKTWRHSGPAVSVVQEEGVKRILGVVPVQADGSVYFKVPAGRSLYFQLLDADYRCLQTMRSFTGVMPGERRGCIGCHETHSTAAPKKRAIAFGTPPAELTPTPWGTESISYERFVQPVFDRYCGECHQGDAQTRKAPDLTLRPGHDVFKEPYLTLVGSAGWGNPVHDRGQAGYGIAGAIPVESMDKTMNDPEAYRTLRPLTMLSHTSPLIKLAMTGAHYDVKVDAYSRRRLIAWVDACCPFMGEPEIRALADPDFPGIEELPIRPRVATAPRIERP